MIIKIALSVLGMLLLAAAVIAGYSYYDNLQNQTIADTLMRASSSPVSQTTEAIPDNTVLAGPVLAIASKSITLTKQDGSTAELGIASTTHISMAGQGAEAGSPKKVSDITVGMKVLVTPSSTNAALAQSIVLLPASPAQ